MYDIILLLLIILKKFIYNFNPQFFFKILVYKFPKGLFPTCIEYNIEYNNRIYNLHT